MAIKDLIEKAKGFVNREPEEFDDNETRDKFLRSLRRERRTQMEELEKKRLVREIAEFKKEQIKKNMFGVDNEESLLKEKRNILGKKAKANKAIWLGKQKFKL